MNPFLLLGQIDDHMINTVGAGGVFATALAFFIRVYWYQSKEITRLQERVAAMEREISNIRRLHESEVKVYRVRWEVEQEAKTYWEHVCQTMLYTVQTECPRLFKPLHRQVDKAKDDERMIREPLNHLIESKERARYEDDWRLTAAEREEMTDPEKPPVEGAPEKEEETDEAAGEGGAESCP